MKSIIELKEIEKLSKTLHQEGKKVVLVGGCFDLLHYGHISFLTEAKKQGDILIVLLESDTRIQQLKGAERPLHTQSQRATMLIAIKDVDYVVLLPDVMNYQSYDNIVKQLQPAIIAITRGSESLQYIDRQAKENNAMLYFVDPIENLSTSRIVELLEKEM